MRFEQLKKGNPLLFKPDNSNGVIPCVVLEVSGDLAKAEIDGGTLLINAETIEQFQETTLEDLAKVIVCSFLDPWEIEPEMNKSTKIVLFVDYTPSCRYSTFRTEMLPIRHGVAEWTFDALGV